MSATRRILAAAVLLAILAPAAGAGSVGGSFRLWEHGARDLALGGAATLLAPGAEALFTQPASLVGMDGWEAGVGLRRLGGGPDLYLSSAVAGWSTGHRPPLASERTPTSLGAAAGAFQYLGATLADDTTWGEWTLAGGLAWSPLRWLSVGARGSLSGGGHEDGADVGRAVSLSAGLRAVILHPALEFGYVAEDIHHRFRWEGGEDRRREPAQVVALAGRLPWRVAAECLGRYRFETWERVALGAEWEAWPGRLALRGGLARHGLGEARWTPSLGFGLDLGAFRLDYGAAFDGGDGPGAEHRLALLWRGGGP